MHRARTRVLVAPEWSSNTTTNATYGPSTESSVRKRLSQLVSDGAVVQDRDHAVSAAEASKPAVSGQLEPANCVSNAVAPSPAPEPAASASAPHLVLYPPPLPPYAPVRSAWPEAALIDLIKQQALFPTDVNVRVGCLALGASVGAPRDAALLRALSEEAQTSIMAAPASASFQFVQLLAEVCSRAGGGQQPGDGQSSSSRSALSQGQGQAQAWCRPPLPAPAVALAAAASGRGLAPQLEAAALGAPAALVGFEGDWLAVQPAVLPCWDKVSLEPCGPPKVAQYYVVCGEQHSSAARMFVRDVSATFLAMRLGTHTPGRTPAHLHAIDGVIPVPLDPGPGPPPLGAAAAGVDGSAGDATAAAATAAAMAAAALGYNPLARRPDPAVIRSAILGFRSNHAAASVAGGSSWTPDEPCYRPRHPCGAAAAPTTVVDAGPPAATSGDGVLQAGGMLCHYWRNLRHIGRQLQRHLLLQSPQQQQRDPGCSPGAEAGLGCGPQGNGSGRGGVGPTESPLPQPPVDAAPPVDGAPQVDAAPPALVVYLVPPSEREEDVLRALMEVCACLAPVTPAARAPPAPAPLAAPGRRDSAAGTCTASQLLQQPAWRRRPSPLRELQQAQAPGCDGAGGGCNGTAAAAAPTGAASGQEAMAAASGGSSASTPPERPAAAASSAAASGARCCGAGGAGAPAGANGDATDPALLSRLGGAARHLYRASCGPSFSTVTGLTAAAAAHGASPQLDLSQLAAMDLTIQVVLPSSLYDITGASVRATACAAYSKLCRRRAGYGAAAAKEPSTSVAAKTGPATGMAMMTTPTARGGSSDGSCCVLSSCSGLTTLYEPLIALAPLTLPAAAAEDDATLAATPPLPLSLPPPPPPPPSLLQQRGLSPSFAWETAAASSPYRTADVAAAAAAHHAAGLLQRQQPQQEHGSFAPQEAAVAPAPPTLHGCYAWWRCPPASMPYASVSGTVTADDGQARHLPLSGQPTSQQLQQQQRCWLAMAFCDVEGRLLDARALALCLDPDGLEPGSVAAEAAASALAGFSGGAAPPPCGCRSDGCPASRGDDGADGGVRRLSRRAGSDDRLRSSVGGAVAPGDWEVGNGDSPPGGWGQPHSLGHAAAGAPIRPFGHPPAGPPAPALPQSSSSPAVAAEAATSLDALVCRTVLGHARLLSRQLVEEHKSDVAAAACTEDGFSPVGATRRQGPRSPPGALALVKLGPPAAAEAAEWRALLLQQPTTAAAVAGGAGERRGSGGSLRRRWDQAAPPPTAASSTSAAATGEDAVTLGWLEPHPSVATHPGCRLPQGGFAVSSPADLTHPAIPPPPHQHQQHPNPPPSNGAAAAAGAYLPVTLVAFPAQRPPSACCAAAEALNRHLRLLSVHPWPRSQPPPTSPFAGSLGAAVATAGPAQVGAKQAWQQQQGIATVANGTIVSVANPKRLAACSTAHSPGSEDGAGGGPSAGPEPQTPGCHHQHKRRRWGERVDGAAGSGGAVSSNADTGGGGVAGCAPGWSDPGWSTLRELYGLCLLRDWTLAAQSGARGGHTPGRLHAMGQAGGCGGPATAAAGGGAWDGGVAGADLDGGPSDGQLLLPLHAAICRQLVRVLVACEQLVSEA